LEYVITVDSCMLEVELLRGEMIDFVCKELN
jgi:hypothetical protein